MTKTLTLGSLFDGSGGFLLAGLLCGIRPIWASEIEPFPIRVTTKRLPFIKHYGDVSQIEGGKIEPVDIITFGSPCTDMSMAGKRAGLEGNQSVLFYQAIRIVKEMRRATDGKYPRFIIWENVPGAFSSGGGADFQSVLEAIVGIVEPGSKVPAPEKGKWAHADCLVGNGWSLAYRTLDAQYFGVPQRRRRIYLVADFADERAQEILFESKGVRRDFTPGFSPRQGTAENAESGSGTPGAICLNDQGGAIMNVSTDIVGTLRAQMDGHPPCVVDKVENRPTPKTLKIRCGKDGGGKGPLIQDNISATLSCNNDQTLFVRDAVFENHLQDSRYKGPLDVAPSVVSRYGTGGNNQPLVMKAYGICADKSFSMLSDNPHSGIYEAGTSRTLDRSGWNPACNQGGIAVVALQGSMIGREEKNGPQGSGIDEDVSFTLNTADRHAVAYAMTTGSFSQITEEQSPTLLSRDYKDAPVVGQMDEDYIVRRLTPTECARLQGFPDDWCSGLETDEPTENEITFWTEVWETHRKIMGTSSKPKSRNQILKWLNEPYSDSAEYKMWGNGVALPCVCFVLKGITEATERM